MKKCEHCGYEYTPISSYEQIYCPMCEPEDEYECYNPNYYNELDDEPKELEF
jgi:hypothetical protein